MVVARCSRYNTGDWSRQMADEDELKQIRALQLQRKIAEGELVENELFSFSFPLGIFQFRFLRLRFVWKEGNSERSR